MSINMRLIGALQFFLFTAFALIANPGFAQEGGNLEEIIVTATKREERLQDVPMSISVLGQDDIVSRGIESPDDIARRTAGLDFKSVGRGLNSQYIIRGVSMSANQNTNVNKTVMVYFDDMPITSPMNNVQADLNLYDIGQIEVLKGPQGTLFGAGSLAGVVRLISNKPDTSGFDYSGHVDIGSTSGEMRKRVSGMVNMPLSDTMALRAVGYMRAEDGWHTNIVTGASPSDNNRDQGARLALSWEVNDDLSARLGYVYHDQEAKDLGLFDPSLGQYNRASFKPEAFPAEVKFYNLTLDYDLGFAMLTSSTNYLDSYSKQQNDLTGAVRGAPWYDGEFQFGIDFSNTEDAKVQEIRLASTGDGRFQWIVGGFYSERENNYKQVLHTSDAYVEFKGGTITGLANEPGYADNAMVYGSYRNNIARENALFAELSYDLTDRLTGTIGFRKAEVEQDDTRIPGGCSCWPMPFLGAVVIGGGNSFEVTPYPLGLFGTGKQDADTSKFSLAYQANDNINLYFNAAEGFRAPKFNGSAVNDAVSAIDPTDIVINLVSKSDTLWNYEIGLKSTLLDGRMTANVSLYQIDWSDIQFSSTRRSDSAGFIANAGAAEISGLEIDMFGAVSDGFNIGFNMSVSSASITEATTDEEAATGAIVGAPLVSPDFKASLFLEKYMDIGGKEVVLRGDIQHVDSMPNGMPNTVGRVGVPNGLYRMMDSYQNINTSIGWNMGGWNIQLYGENILNNDDYTYILSDPSLHARYGTLRPRTFGIRVSTD